jgi:hypothetical protein
LVRLVYEDGIIGSSFTPPPLPPFPSVFFFFNIHSLDPGDLAE